MAGLEEANVNAVNRLLRAKQDSETWTQKVTLVEEGLLQLARSVQHALARKHGVSDQSMVLVGASPLNSPALPPLARASSHLLPSPEKGLRAVELEKAVEAQLETLLAACEREKHDRAERERSAAEAERTQAARRRAIDESNSQAAMELAKTFISPKTGGAAAGIVPRNRLEMDSGSADQEELPTH